MPLYVGYDLNRKGRIFKYDITGGRYEESDHHSIGSGGKGRSQYHAGVLPAGASGRTRLFESGCWRCLMLRMKRRTGGPDLVRGIFPLPRS